MEPTQEIINNAKQLYSLSWISPELKSALENDFPELKESEDERIRKEIIEYLTITREKDLVAHPERQRWITYLEKQKVQDVKVISWREPDDCADIPEGHYVVIAYTPGIFGLGYIGNGKVVCAPGQKPSGILYIPNADESIIVESKEQKPTEWSEEDENRFRNLIYLVERSNEGKGTKEGFVKFINRLKSLRPQPHWKPSKKQMWALEWKINNTPVHAWQRKELESIYKELLKSCSP